MKLPSEPCTSNSVLTGIYKGEELHRHLKNNINIFTTCLASNLNQFGCDNEIDLNKRIELHKKSIGIYELIYENGDYGFYNCRLAEYYMGLAKCYAALYNTESTIESLEKSLKYAVTYDTLAESEHTSVIFRGDGYNLSGSGKQYSYNDCYRLLNDFGLKSEEFDFIKSNARYIEIIAEFEKYAK